MKKPDTAAALAGLKDFQRRTVDHVFARLYREGGSRRFLVADEVGLGKTLVAKGVIARVIDNLWDEGQPIEIIYICSNQDIARQNIRRLKVAGCGEEEMRATRLSLLPLEPRRRGAERVNFIALTPGTSFDLTSGGGQARERAVLYCLLQRAWGFGEKSAPWNVLAEHGARSFEAELKDMTFDALDQGIARRFIERVATAKELRAEFEELCCLYPRSDSKPRGEDAKKRNPWLGKMRTEITRVCIESLRPSLIIMDEFQRFRDLLNEETGAGSLAADLFGYAGTGSDDGPRTLLLSATPYKMLALRHEQEEDHYGDLLKTLSFLDGGERLPQWKKRFRDYQDSVLRLREGAGHEGLLACRDALAGELCRVMVRTERLAGTADREGMLADRIFDADALRPEDVRSWFALQSIADQLKQDDCMEYWKSAPYVLNFMDRYQLSKAFANSAPGGEHGRALHKLVARYADTFLPAGSIENYKPVPFLNGRLRALQRETLDCGAWRLLWVPPSLPHYALGGVFAAAPVQHFTKSLVFSAWHVVPKAVASLLSYEAERLMMRAGSPKGRLPNTVEARKKRKPLLRFNHDGNRARGMPLFMLIYPCLTLAERVDPAGLAVEMQTSLPPLEAVLAAAEARLAGLMAPLLEGARGDGPEDERWYWLAPLLLDRQHHPAADRQWWAQRALAKDWMLISEEDDEEQHHAAWTRHVNEARACADGAAGEPGRPPADLCKWLARMAVAGPATCALRALAGEGERASPGVRLASGRIGHAFLAMFNLPEVRSLLHSMKPDERYWMRVLNYACEGGLQAVFDEYVHLLAEDRQADVAELSRTMCEALHMRTSVLRADHITAPPDRLRVKVDADLAMRVRFAMRFGDDRAETDTIGNRKEAVRQAFNSPFWPFVLVTTSVGQEGLDFHRYCHRVVHWNLPSNPVDLEQREGRVHRYKGHAVRKNVSQHYRDKALKSGSPDLWKAAFAEGAAARRPGESEITPYWTCQGNAKIERCVPLPPMSRETAHLQQLLRALTIYRMAFGHSRQEDVIEHLLARVPEGQRESLCQALRIDLSPPGGGV